MNGMRIEKELCPVGEELEHDLDNLIEKQRKEFSAQRSQEIYKLLKAYFYHRRNCFECKVAIGYER